MSNARQIADVAPTLGRKNHIINGSFWIWQRGTSPFTSNGLTVDRWYMGSSQSSHSLAFAQYTPGSVPGLLPDPYHYPNITVTSVSNANAIAYLLQKIEYPIRFSGQKMTVSFWAACGAGTTKKMGVNFAVNYGTGGSPSTADYSTAQAVDLEENFAKFELTFDIPDMTGKTFGTDGNANLQLQFWFDAGTNYQGSTKSGLTAQQSGTFYIVNVQAELGEQATEFERQTKTEVELDCFRYYLNIGVVYGQYYAYSTSSTGRYMLVKDFPVKMRDVPTISGSYTNFTLSNNYTSTMQMILFNNTANSGGSFISTCTADAEL